MLSVQAQCIQLINFLRNLNGSFQGILAALEFKLDKVTMGSGANLGKKLFSLSFRTKKIGIREED